MVDLGTSVCMYFCPNGWFYGIYLWVSSYVVYKFSFVSVQMVDIPVYITKLFITVFAYISSKIFLSLK